MTLPLRSAQEPKELLVECVISDLFFYMDHSAYKVRKEMSCYGPSDLQEAIEEDAIKMQLWLAELGHEVTIEQLVNDFFDRI